MKEFMHPYDSSHVDNEFNRFIGKHGRKYITAEEHENRKNLFRQNLRFVHSKNRAKLGYSLTINHLADKSSDEMKALRGYRPSGIYNGLFYHTFIFLINFYLFNNFFHLDKKKNKRWTKISI